MGRLTDSQIKQWIQDREPLAGKSDGGGLTFTMSKAQAVTGSGVWTLRYRLAGKRKELTLGRYPDVSLAMAREIASGKRIEILEGVDVAVEKKVDMARQVITSRLAQLAKDVESTGLQVERIKASLSATREALIGIDRG
jgi:hypothetical protein